jgi:hypothetical protein
MHLLFTVAVLLVSILFALVEIQIEGPHGWASRLPTWRIENRWTRWLCGSRPLTGYHLYVWLFVLAVAHLPFLLALCPWSWPAQLRIAAFLILFWIVEDFLWFALNPAFGLRRFRRRDVWWHARAWWWIMPREYWLGIPAALAIYWLAVRA